MTESYGFKFVVDANDAAKGWKQFESAVEGVFGALDKMETHVEKTMGALKKATKSGKTDINAFTKAASELGRIKVNASAAKNITTLSAAMKGYKAPSAVQVKNTQAFFKALGNSGTGGGAAAGRNIGAISAAMAGFKAPSATNVRNLRDFFSALASYRSPAGLTNAAGFISTLRQLAGFRAPGAAQVRNLQAFLNTVSNLQIPRNGAQIANVLSQIARAASASNASLRGLRGSLGGMPWGQFNNGAQSARLNMMGLQNAFSGTFQVGSALRVLLGSLTIGELGTKFFEATNAAMQFKAQMSVINKEAGFAGLQLEYVNSVANQFGVDMLAAEQGFAKVSIAADKSGISVAQTRHVFEGMTTAMSVLGITTAGQGDVWLALQQVMNKGYLSAEELNQQLNEKLPGAMAYAGEYAAKLGVSLEKGLKTKALDAAGVLEHISRRMKEDFGPAVAAALERPSAQMNILKNNFMMFFQAIGENGGNEAFVDLLKMINEQMTPEKIQAYSRAIGETLKSAVDSVASAFAFLRDNWDSIKGPLSTTLSLLGQWMIVSSALQIGRFIVQPLMMVGGAVGGLQAVGAAMTGIMRVATAGSLMQMVVAANALTGTSRAVAVQIMAARNAITMMSLAARGGAGSLFTLAGAMGVVRGASGLFVAGLRGIVAMLGGPLLLGLAAAGYAIYSLYNSWSDGHSVVETTNDLIAKNRKKVDEATAAIYLNKTGVGENAKFQGIMGMAINSGNSFLDSYKQKLDEATGGLYSMAEAARAATIETLKLARADLTGRMTALKMEDSDSLYALGDQIRADKSQGWLKRNLYGAGATFKGGIEQVQDAIGWNGDKKLRKQGMNSLQGEINNTDALIAQAQGTNAYDIAMEMKKRGYNGSGTKPAKIEDETEEKKKKGRKGPKAPDPMKEMDKLQRVADGIIRRLGEDNPVLKLQNEYINDLTEQAQGLLTDAGYTDYMKKVKESGGGVTDMFKILQDEIEGAGADTKILTDLATRYNISVDMLTASMDQQIKAFREKEKLAREAMLPGATLLKQASEEIRYARMSIEQSDILRRVQEAVNASKLQANALDQAGIDKLTEKLELQEKHLKLLDAEREFYQNNGLKKYTSEVQTAGEAVQEMDYNVMRSLEDTIFRIGKEGKLSFKNLFDTIQDGLLKFASQGITEKLGGLLSGGTDPKNPTMMGKLFGAMGFDTGFDKQKAMDRIEAQTVNLYTGRINVNGELETSIGGFMGSQRDANGEIVVQAAKPPATLAEEMSKPILDNVEAAGKLIKTDWGGAISSMGPLLSSALGAGLGGLIGGKTGAAVGGIASMLLPALMGGGGGGFGGFLASIFGGKGPGMFKEGGFSNSPVAWAKAPHYAEGTGNTSGGIPAILHDNEAVIPLSRGRKVPVALTNGGGSGSGTVINNTWNVQSPDADSFQRSQQQMTGQMHRAATRAAQRNS